jgi:hypothetical protein
MSGRRSFCRRILGCGLAIGCGAGSILAAGDRWADSLFHEAGHDFGPVPRGAQVRHDFTFTNTTGETLTVSDIRASCGCTTGRVLNPTIEPGQTGTIEARMDTRNFVGVKSTSLIVTLYTSGGRHAEVRLGVRSNILSDIVLNPGWLDFGVLPQGQTSRLAMTIDRYGAPDWKVLRLMASRRLSETIDATINESYRDSSEVGYTLTVVVKPSAPVGPVREEIKISTNDAETPIVTVLVTAEIRGALSASPSLLSLGQVSTGAPPVRGRFLIRAARPFSIQSIEGAGEGFELEASEGAPKPLQVVNLTFHPDRSSTQGEIRRSFQVITDLAGEPPVTLNAAVDVLP